MALREVTLPVRFSGGLETKLDDKVVPLGRFIELRDAVFARGGTAAKRNGNAALSTAVLGSASAIPTPLALGQRADELLAFTDDEAYSYIEGPAAWVKAGDLQSVNVSHRPVAKTGTDQTLADMAVNGGVALYGWEDSAGGVWYALLDDDTGRVLVAPTQMAAGAQRPRVVAIGEYLHLLYILTAPREIRIRTFSPTNPLDAPTDGILVTDLSLTAPCFDVDVDDAKGVIAWAATSGQIGVGYLHSTGALGGVGTGLATPVYITAAVDSAVAVASDKTQSSGSRSIAVAWNEAATRVRYAIRNADLTSALAPTTADAGGAPAPTQITACWYLDADVTLGRAVALIYEETAAAPGDHTVRSRRMNAAGAGDTVRLQRGVGLGSKAFLDGAAVYVHLVRDSTLYRTYFTYRFDVPLVVARFLPGLGAGLVTKSHLPGVQATAADARQHTFAAIYVTDVESPSGDVFTEKGIRRVSLDFDSDEAFRSVQLGASTYVAGGLLHVYDGQRAVEAGFHYGIDDVADPTIAAAAGTGIAIGTRNYVFVLENTLANGEVERGPISAPITVVFAENGRRATFAIPTCRLTAKPGARIGVFRTLDGDSSTYARVSSFDPTTVGQVNGYVANTTSADTVAFVDEMTDDELEEQDPLYSNGGIVENDPIGGARLVAVAGNRLLVVDQADPLAVYPSQVLAEGYAVEVSPFLRFTVDPYGGDITAIIAMDDLKAIFKRSAIMGVSGPGPFANPETPGGGWTAPELITSDVGCIGPDALGYTPVGIIFQSLKGIHLLGRDRSVKYIGAPVERFTDPTREGQTVVATTLIEDRHEIRLLMSSGESLLYDYEYDSWSSWTIRGLDALLIGGVYHHLRGDGAIWRETAGVYRDINLPISHFCRTPWITLTQLLGGFQRIWTLILTGEYRSAHRLRVRAFYDFEAGHDDEWIFNPADFINLPGYGAGNYGAGNYGEGGGGVPSRRYQIEAHVGRQCAAVQFTFEFIEDTGVFGAAGELTEMTIRGGAIGDRFPQVDARRA